MNSSRLSPGTLEALKRSGWKEGRSAFALLSRWDAEFFVPCGISPPMCVRATLLALGGLRVEQGGAGREVWRATFTVDPTVARAALDRFRDLEAELQRPLFPIGQIEDGIQYLAQDVDGRVLVLEDDAWLLGVDIEEALDALVLGRLGVLL